MWPMPQLRIGMLLLHTAHFQFAKVHKPVGLKHINKKRESEQARKYPDSNSHKDYPL